MNLVYPSPPPKKKIFFFMIVFNFPGFYSRPKRNSMLQQYNNTMVMHFFFWGGEIICVNKALYGLCENGEYSWTFSPKTSVLIGYFDVSRR